MWLMAVGEAGIDWTRGLGYEHSNLVLQAAEQGDGVAIARSVLAADALAAGRLVKPFDVSLPAAYAYHLVCPPDHLKRPKVQAFREWLLAEARAAAGHAGTGGLSPPKGLPAATRRWNHGRMTEPPPFIQERQPSRHGDQGARP